LDDLRLADAAGWVPDVASRWVYSVASQQFHHGDELMARTTAEHLIEYLELAGFVVMRKPPLRNHKIP
jgi:hypothetical protein